MSLFNKIAPIYALFFDFQVRYFQRIEKRGREYIDISKYKSVLDVGCGTGALCKVLKDKGLEVTGVEPSLGMLKQAKKKLRGEDIILKQVTPEERFPFKNKSFDLVITSYVAHGLKPRERIWLYKEMRRLSKEVVIIHDYNKTRGLMTTIVEWLENGDYFNFIKVAQREMEKVFENVEVGNVDTRAAWYICSPKKEKEL